MKDITIPSNRQRYHSLRALLKNQHQNPPPQTKGEGNPNIESNYVPHSLV